MSLKNASLQTRLYCAAIALFLAGSGWAVYLYRTAKNADESELVSEFLNSKRYLHDVKSYGGNASVLADQFSRWFEKLWQGESLAFTVASITIAVSLVLLFIGYHSPPHE